ncbi:hypothetical protein SAMN05428964_11411, partial [Thalassospira xiamenensis]
MHLCVVTLCFLVLRGTPKWPFEWLAAMALISVLLGGTSAVYSFGSTSLQLNSKHWLHLHAMFTTIAGLIWGTGAILCSLETPDKLLFYTLALGGTALGAVSSQHSYLVSCYLSLWTSIPMLSVAHFLAGTNLENRVAGILILLFGVMLSILGWRMYRFLANNVALNKSLDAKVNELEDVRHR